MVDVLLPGERETFRGPLHRPRRRAAPAGGAQRRRRASRDVGGVDFVVEDASVVEERDQRRRHRQPDDHGRPSRGSIDGEALPIGDWIRDERRRGPGRARRRADRPRRATLPLTAVREGRPVVPQPLLHGAESAPRRGRRPEIPDRGHRAGRRRQPRGGDGRPARRRRASSTSTAVIASLNPDEFAGAAALRPAVPRRRPGRARRRRGRRSIVDHRPHVRRSPAAATRATSTIDRPDRRDHRRGRVGDDRAARRLLDRHGRREQTRSTRATTADEMPALDEVVDDPEADRGAARRRPGRVRRLREPRLRSSARSTAAGTSARWRRRPSRCSPSSGR